MQSRDLRSICIRDRILLYGRKASLVAFLKPEDEVYEAWNEARRLLHRGGNQVNMRRSVASDVPTDLIIRVNTITFLLHKCIVLPKSGLMQRLCSKEADAVVDLHDIPGGEDAFELCAKFCYGISINLCASTFVPAYCAAKFLRMTEAVQQGNLIFKLEVFFSSCILQGWKDSIVALQATTDLPEWSENLGIVRRCIDSIVEKILTPCSQVNWKYTYTRPGYSKKPLSSIAPKDWWTEDISNLCLEVFRSTLMAIRSTGSFPSQLIGEALHVYIYRWLPDVKPISMASSSSSEHQNEVEKKRRILETVVSMIPLDERSVSVGFLIRLLSMANILGASPVTKSQLVRQTSLQLDEATVSDLVDAAYDPELIKAVLESFLEQWRRRQSESHVLAEGNQLLGKVGRLIDSYLGVVARDPDASVFKFVSLAETLPDAARPKHDDLYKAINIFLKEHPDMTKAEKKLLCSALNCQKLSSEVRAHAVRNERLPLRTVVQVLFFEQDGGKAPSISSSTRAGHTQEIESGALDGPQNATVDGRSRPRKK